MQTKIELTSSNDAVSIRWSGGDDFTLLDEQGHWKMTLSEETIKELPKMIEEILQMKNKRDW